VVHSAGRLGGSTQEFVIAPEGVFRDVELGQGRKPPWGSPAVVIAQGAEAQLTAAQGSPQVALHRKRLQMLPLDLQIPGHLSLAVEDIRGIAPSCRYSATVAKSLLPRWIRCCSGPCFQCRFWPSVAPFF